MRKRSGFTYIEATVSVAILAIISSITVASLYTTSQSEQLDNAAQLLTADLRTLQSQALTASSINACLDGSSKYLVCALSTAGCSGACGPQIPADVGMRLAVTQSSYTYFADVEPTKTDWKQTDATEVFFNRSFAGAGAPNVVISAISTGSPVDIAFERQNGNMDINGCRLSQGSCTPTNVTITLQQTQTHATKSVTMNALTGRISIN